MTSRNGPTWMMSVSLRSTKATSRSLLAAMCQKHFGKTTNNMDNERNHMLSRLHWNGPQLDQVDHKRTTMNSKFHTTMRHSSRSDGATMEIRLQRKVPRQIHVRRRKTSPQDMQRNCSQDSWSFSSWTSLA